MEKALLNMAVAFVNPCNGTFVHQFLSMVLPLERRLALAPQRNICCGLSMWSQEEEVASEIARLGMTDAIHTQVYATMA
jgi:hypothetical protein